MVSCENLTRSSFNCTNGIWNAFVECIIDEIYDIEIHNSQRHESIQIKGEKLESRWMNKRMQSNEYRMENAIKCGFDAKIWIVEWNRGNHQTTCTNEFEWAWGYKNKCPLEMHTITWIHIRSTNKNLSRFLQLASFPSRYSVNVWNKLPAIAIEIIQN